MSRREPARKAPSPPVAPSVRSRPLTPFAIAALAFLASILVAHALGVAFDATPVSFLWQYLDEDILRHDLLRGVYYLHSQPPLFNLYLGLVLQLFPASAPAAFSAGHQAVALAVLMSVAWILWRLGVPDVITALLCLLVAVHPVFIVHSRWLFYTLPVALLLLLSVIALLHYSTQERPGFAHAFSWLAACLMLTRAIFHPLWFVVVLGVISRLLAPPLRRGLLVSAIAPLLVVNLWYLKNYELVGTYTASSWLGMNLRRGLTLSGAELTAMIGAGRVPTVFREADGFPLDLEEYPQYLDPAAAPLHPALDAAYKGNRYWNFNHRAYARIARDMLRGDVQVIEAYPDRYVRRVYDAIRLFLQPGPRLIIIDRYFPQTFGTAVARYRDFLDQVLFLRPVVVESPSDAAWLAVPNLLWFGFPALSLYGLACALGRPRALLPIPAPAARPVYAYLTATILWFTVCANLFEFGENDRMRIEIDPLLVVLLGCALAAAYRGFTGLIAPTSR